MDERQFVTRAEFDKLSKKVNIMEIKQTRAEARIEHIEKKLDKIESNTTWILRLIMGAIVMAVIGLVIQGGV